MTVTVQGNVSAFINDVQKTQQYVLHSVMLNSGRVSVGDTVTLLVDEVSSHVAAVIIIITSVIFIHCIFFVCIVCIFSFDATILVNKDV